jgi:N-acetylglucosamine-6-phosphate deacetylase
MPEGHYTLGGFDVEVKGGVGWHNGIVAGSVLTMDRAVSNFASFTHAPLSTVTRLASANPAAMIGCADSYGAIIPGRRADIIALSPEGRLVATCIAGHFARLQ